MATASRVTAEARVKRYRNPQKTMPTATAGVAVGDSPASTATRAVASRVRLRTKAVPTTAAPAQARSSARKPGSLESAPHAESATSTPTAISSVGVPGPESLTPST